MKFYGALRLPVKKVNNTTRPFSAGKQAISTVTRNLIIADAMKKRQILPTGVMKY